jgi:hypothetical protein
VWSQTTVAAIGARSPGPRLSFAFGCTNSNTSACRPLVRLPSHFTRMDTYVLRSFVVEFFQPADHTWNFMRIFQLQAAHGEDAPAPRVGITACAPTGRYATVLCCCCTMIADVGVALLRCMLIIARACWRFSWQWVCGRFPLHFGDEVGGIPPHGGHRPPVRPDQRLCVIGQLECTRTQAQFHRVCNKESSLFRSLR